MEFDGVASGSDYVGAASYTWPLSNGQRASAKLTHYDGALFVCIEGMARVAPGQFAAIMIDVDGSGSAELQSDDLVVEVNPDGRLAIWTPQSGSSWASALAPVALVEAAVFTGDTHWSVELRLPDSVIGGWNHPARIRPYVATNGQYPYDSWPVGSDHHGPATWAPVQFGSLPSPLPQAPIARAEGSGSFAPTTEGTFHLDASQSTTSNGETTGLTYFWTQTEGPPVALVDPTAPSTTFVKGSVTTPVVLTFQLVVSDAVLNSEPAEVRMYFSPPPQQTPHGPTLAKSGGVELTLLPDGTVQGCFDANYWFRSKTNSAVPATGAFFTVEMSTDLTNWTPISSGPATISGLVRFIDDNAPNDPKRFYRLRQ